MIPTPSWFHRSLTILLGAALCVLASITPSWAADPETEVGKFLGQGLAGALELQGGVVTDPLLTGWIDRMGARLAAVSPRQNLPYHFAILDTAEPNAFTLPGGYVFVTRGLLDYAIDRDELAGVIGHEVGHVAGNHPMRLIEWQLGASLFLKLGPVPHDKVSVTAGQVALFLLTLQFSRQDESQADQYGIKFATQAGYDPAGLARFLESLGGSRSPSFIDKYLSTHPPDSVRVKALLQTPYLEGKDGGLEQNIGERLLQNCRPAIALPHLERAIRLRPGEADLTALIEKARAQKGERTVGKPATREVASEGIAALDKARLDVLARCTRAYKALVHLSNLERLNGMLRDGLLGATATRLDDIRWLALAFQAYGQASRLNDVYSRIARLESRLTPDVVRMRNEVALAPDDAALRAEGVKAAREALDASAVMTASAAHFERGAALLSAVLADLDVVLLGFTGQISNVRFATVQAALLASGHEIEAGRSLATRSLDLAALAEDRELVARIDRMGREADAHRLEDYDCNEAQFLGHDAISVQAARTAAGGYGAGALMLALEEETNQKPGAAEQRYQEWRNYRQSRSATPVSLSRVDAIVEEGGSPALLEIMLRQIAAAMQEEDGAAGAG